MICKSFYRWCISKGRGHRGNYSQICIFEQYFVLSSCLYLVCFQLDSKAFIFWIFLHRKSFHVYVVIVSSFLLPLSLESFHMSHSCNTLISLHSCIWCTTVFSVQPMDLSWNPFSCGGLFMSAPSLVEKLRKQQCTVSRQFLTALSLCHSVMAEWKKGCLFVCLCHQLFLWLGLKWFSSLHLVTLLNLSLCIGEHWFIIEETLVCEMHQVISPVPWHLGHILFKMFRKAFNAGAFKSLNHWSQCDIIVYR